MPRPMRVTDNMNPPALNSLLLRAYGFELLDFAFSLAVVLSKKPLLRLDQPIWVMKKEGIPFITKSKRELAHLVEIKSKLDRVVEDLDDHLNSLEYWDTIRAGVQKSFLPQFFPTATAREPLDKKTIILDCYSLKAVYETIEKESEYLKPWVDLLSPKGHDAGRYTLAITIIAALWSRVITYKRKTDWKNLWALISWFYARLGNADYRTELDGHPSPESIYRFRDRFQRELRKDRLYFFAHNYRSPKLRRIVKPKPIQVRFTPQNPKLIQRDREDMPLISFSDGANLPGS